jgi:hypothetical protein
VSIPSIEVKQINAYLSYSNYNEDAKQFSLMSANNLVKDLRDDVVKKGQVSPFEIIFAISGFNGKFRIVNDD